MDTTGLILSIYEATINIDSGRKGVATRGKAEAGQNFKDALLALKAVEETCYKIAEQIYPHSTKFQIKGFSKDTFHIACIAYRTRLQNMLRTLWS